MCHFRLRVIYAGGDNLPKQVDVEIKSVFENVEPTLVKNVEAGNSSYNHIPTGE